MKPLAWLVGTFSLVLVACGGGSSGGGAARPDPTVPLESSLVAFPTCSDLETYVKDTAVLQMREMLEGYGRYPYPMEAGADANAGGGTKSTPTNPDYSQTNSQVAGVDDADFVKTDGHRVFYLSGGRLEVLTSWPATDTAIASETVIEGWPIEMFLDGDRLVVFSAVPQYAFDPTVAQPTVPVDYYYGYWYGDATKVSVFDVSTDTPAPVNTWYLAGMYTTSRRVGSSVRMVMGGQLHWPQIQYWPNVWDPDPVQRQLATEALAAQNEQIIRAWPLSAWLARSYFVSNGQTTEVPLDCTHYFKPTTPSRLGLSIVASLDLSQASPTVSQTALISEVGQTFASADNLYIATPNWWWGWWWNVGSSNTGDQTFVHKFSLAQADQVSYLASGTVRGHILDQFSMDEHDGYLRVATTTWNGWTSQTGMQTENHVVVLGQQNTRLQIVGSTPNLAPNEQIYSSRFSGDKGFVVTYRQVDPLFTLDLSDPTLPRVVGSLHIPGFSTYLHLLDATHLLTIGEDTVPGQSGGETRNGIMLELFDVSDMAHPLLTAKTLLGTRYSYSEAMWDHKAFNFFPKTGMLAVPFCDWNQSATGDYWGSFVSALKVFHIDAGGSVTPVGQVDHADFYEQRNQESWYWWYMPYVRRSVQIENYVYSFSDAGIKVNDTADLTTTVKSIALPLPVWYRP